MTKSIHPGQSKTRRTSETVANGNARQHWQKCQRLLSIEPNIMKGMFDLIYHFDSATPESRKVPASAEEARQSLVEGNHDFAQMTEAGQRGEGSRVITIDPQAFGWGVASEEAPLQAPFAAVLGCADARVPIEAVFARGYNELFVVRVAGNVLGDECLGSMRYAMQHFPSTLKLLVVLAHGKCGAVTEAVSVYLEPRRYLALATDPAIRSIVDQILVTVRVSAIAMETLYGASVATAPGYRSALIEAAVVLNAAWSAFCLRQEFRSAFPDVGVAFGAYDLVSRYVRLPLSKSGEPTEGEKGLFAPPSDVDGFRQLAHQICSGNLVESHLQMVEKRPNRST